MKTIEISDARESLGQYAGHREDLPIVVTDHGRPVAALFPVPNADIETVSLSTNSKFLSLIERSRERHGREGGISSAEMRRRLDTAPNNRIEHDQ